MGAFERARAAYGTGAYDDATIEFLFPELKESEDERCRKAIIEDYKVLGDASLRGAKVTLELKNVEEKIAWLEKQKYEYEVFEPVESTLEYKIGFNAGKESIQKAEWSEEDSRILYNVIAYVGYAAGQRGVRDDEFKEANSWLKSLRPRPHWKPSEEQMEALKNSAYGTYQNGDGPALRELYEQLKKLH